MATLGDAVFRVGAGIGGWLIVFGWALVMAIMPQADCIPGDDVLWGSTAIFGFLAGAAGVLCGAGLALKRQLRWLGAAAAPLIAWNLYWIVPAVFTTTLGDQSMCAGSALPPTSWERAWPVIQTTAAAIATLQLVRFWRADIPGNGNQGA
ncbi:MAG: hypothetical protein VX246_13800 [Myxococcota bacterium]|nr:hypothetical protein [Myxococcota bacterium]